MPGILYVVATPIGNLEDITLRALRTLREVQLIAAEDTRRTAKLLTRYEIRTPTTSVHEHNEDRKIPSILAKLEAGHDVALVSDAGTPTISDPGYRLIGAGLDRGMRVEAIPGPSAVLAALVASGLPTDAFTFVGFPPRRSQALHKWLQAVAAYPHVVVFFEAPHRIRETLMAAASVLGDREIVIARELTKIHEQLVKGPISNVLQQITDPKGEFTALLAPATPQAPAEPISATQFLEEFGHETYQAGLSKRRQLALLAKRHGLTVREAYELLEQAKEK